MDWLTGAVNWLGDQINTVLSWICVVLPDSPFKLLEDKTPLHDILPYINYFIPVDFMLSTLSAWCFCILIYYGYSILMRWLKAIQ